MTREAVEAVRARQGSDEEIVTLSTGIRARLVPVSASLVQDAASRVEDPPVPMWYNPDKEREEPNPADPDYLRKLERADQRRGVAAIDVLVVMGVELVDGVPDDDRWLNKLKLLERQGHVDLTGYDLEDALDREFVYKKYVAVGNEDYATIMQFSGVGEGEVRRARRSFRGDAEGDAA